MKQKRKRFLHFDEFHKFMTKNEVLPENSEGRGRLREFFSRAIMKRRVDGIKTKEFHNV